MRLNKLLALSTGLSRRAADTAIAAGEVLINGKTAKLGQSVEVPGDTVIYKGRISRLPPTVTTILLHKPSGYVCSRDGQGSKTVYDLLPAKFRSLKPVGRLDKASTGLLLLTDDGALAHRLTHPSFSKIKLYEVGISKRLADIDAVAVSKIGVQLDDGKSSFTLKPTNSGGTKWQAMLSEGRNRQIRRTFAKLGYEVVSLHRTEFGDFSLGDLPSGKYIVVRPGED